MPEYIPISRLNDFLFCPYSIYLHQVYGTADEEVCKAEPQKAGVFEHGKILDGQETGTFRNLPVFSDEYGIAGVIDEYDPGKKTLTEYKNNLPTVFPGQKMQLWGQYICLTGNGLEVQSIRFVEISTGKEYPIPPPGTDELKNLRKLIDRIRQYDPSYQIETNPNKCQKCIYCPLCEKTFIENDF